MRTRNGGDASNAAATAPHQGNRVNQLVNRAWKEARKGAVASQEKIAMRIARDIVRKIGSEEISSGDPLPSEVDMATSYNVGRTSIREALRILEVQGLVSIRTGPGGGPIVTDPTTADAGRMLSLHMNVRGCTFAEVAKARLQLDPLLAAQAADNATPDLIERLRDIVEMMELIQPNNNASWARTASMFNTVVAAMSGNGALALISSSLRAIYAERIGHIQYTPKMRQNALGFYRKIIEALASRDGAAAEKHTFSLIDGSLKQMGKNYPEILESPVDWR